MSGSLIDESRCVAQLNDLSLGYNFSSRVSVQC